MADAGERALAMLEIHNLVVQYPYVIDMGKFDGVGEFYDGTTVRAFGRDGKPIAETETRTKEEVKAFFESIIVVDGDGFPNTQHLVSNIQVDVSEDAQAATGRSTFTVFNMGEGIPLQCIITGSYEDKYAKVDGKWRLTHRDEFMNLVGEMSGHMKVWN